MDLMSIGKIRILYWHIFHGPGVQTCHPQYAHTIKYMHSSRILRLGSKSSPFTFPIHISMSPVFSGSRLGCGCCCQCQLTPCQIWPFHPVTMHTLMSCVLGTLDPICASLIMMLTDQSPQNILRLIERWVVTSDNKVSEYLRTLEWLRLALTWATTGQPGPWDSCSGTSVSSKLTASACWRRKVQTDLPYLGNLLVLQGATQTADRIGSAISKFINWHIKEDLRCNHNKLEKVGYPQKK
jgi:hypothetical protein